MPSSTLGDELQTAVDFVSRALSGGGDCLVFDRSGRTLAPTVIAAFLIVDRRVDAAAAMRLVAQSCAGSAATEDFFAPPLAGELRRLGGSWRRVSTSPSVARALLLNDGGARNEALTSASTEEAVTAVAAAEAERQWPTPRRPPPPPPSMQQSSALAARAEDWESVLDVSPRRGAVATSSLAEAPDLSTWLAQSGFPAALRASLTKANVTTLTALREVSVDALVTKGSVKLLQARRLVAQARLAL